MRRMDDGPTYDRWLQLETYARSQGLRDAAAESFATMAAWSEFYGYGVPQIVSGLRSEQRQRELRAAWDRGDRAGLVVRPALQSTHTQARAWDLARGPALDFFAYAAPYLGVRWGGTFATPDPVHFDV